MVSECLSGDELHSQSTIVYEPEEEEEQLFEENSSNRSDTEMSSMHVAARRPTTLNLQHRSIPSMIVYAAVGSPVPDAADCNNSNSHNSNRFVYFNEEENRRNRNVSNSSSSSTATTRVVNRPSSNTTVYSSSSAATGTTTYCEHRQCSGNSSTTTTVCGGESGGGDGRIAAHHHCGGNSEHSHSGSDMRLNASDCIALDGMVSGVGEKDKTTFGGTEDTMDVVGVCFVCDYSSDWIGSGPVNGNAVPLGIAVISESRHSISAVDLRRILALQIPTIPTHFVYLTKQMFPVQKTQENMIRASHIITDSNVIYLCRNYDKLKIGVKSITGNILGFIFIEPNLVLRLVRDAINEQVFGARRTHPVNAATTPATNGPLASYASVQTSMGVVEFRFTDGSGLPVSLAQEMKMGVLDCLRENMLIIQTQAWAIGTSMPNLTFSSIPPPTRPTDLKFPTEMAEVDSARKRSDKFRERDKKTILISYARNDTADHAIRIKKELQRLGHPVFLDVDEIKTGSDWQDALNEAVSDCLLFVPLITAQYGKTVWTNREIKLADIRGKPILPINFMNVWPPECLAIQFATTQYVPAFLPDPAAASHHDQVDGKIKDHRSDWSEQDLKRICKEIVDCYKSHLKPFNRSSLKTPTAPKSILQRAMTPVTEEGKSIVESLSHLQVAAQSSVNGEDNVDNTQTKMEEQAQIVISAHPSQRQMADYVKNLCEKEGYSAWCTLDESEETETSSLLNSATSDDVPLLSTPILPSILEGTSTKFRNALSMYRESNSCPDKKRLDRTYSADANRKTAVKRQFSQNETSSIYMSPKIYAKVKRFRAKVDNAKAVILIASNEFFGSSTSKEQAFYTESRCPTVVLHSDDSPIPPWFTSLMNNDVIKQGTMMNCQLKSRIGRLMSPRASENPNKNQQEATIQCLTNFIKKEIQGISMCVYVTGSAEIRDERTRLICRYLGEQLARIQNVFLVTGGFYGVQDTVGRAFYEARMNNADGDFKLFHISPAKDDKNLSEIARQNTDKTFSMVDYGQTLFVGNSLKERDAAISRLFDICILIEGDARAAHEAEQFTWNDHFVIPIISTGGAASGGYNVPNKILEAPTGVSEEKWSVLSSHEASEEEVAQTVAEITVRLKEAIVQHRKSQLSRNRYKVKKRKNRRQPSALTGTESLSTTEPTEDDSQDEPDFPSQPDLREKPKRWQRFVRNIQANFRMRNATKL